MTRRFFVRTFGCQMNEHDSERLARLLVADGMEPADDAEGADVVVLNTCCIRENADNKLYGHLGHLKALQARRPGVQIAVGGCLAQKDRELIQRRAGHVDVVFGTHNLSSAVGLLHRAEVEGPVMEVLEAPRSPEDEFSSALARRDLPHAAWVTIQVGCDNSCAFCIVPSVRGREVSRSFGDIVSEVRGLAASGVREVTLLGQNVNSYGRDITVELRRRRSSGGALPGGEVALRAGSAWAGGPARAKPLFADLLRAVGAVDGVQRVRYTSPHPKDLTLETIAAMAETPSVCEHLHLPLQAGSDRVLAAMRRGYTAERYLGKLRAARAAVPDLAVTTDLIVGFPGETEADFEGTLEVVAEAAYDAAYTFVFSPRPGTRAAAMVDEMVAPEVVSERFSRLRVVVERSALSRNQARVGRTEEVMVEGPSKRDPAVLTGRTRQNKVVHLRGEDLSGCPDLAPGACVPVKVVGAGPHHLDGELATPRRRIPLRGL